MVACYVLNRDIVARAPFGREEVCRVPAQVRVDVLWEKIRSEIGSEGVTFFTVTDFTENWIETNEVTRCDVGSFDICVLFMGSQGQVWFCLGNIRGAEVNRETGKLVLLVFDFF